MQISLLILSLTATTFAMPGPNPNPEAKAAVTPVAKLVARQDQVIGGGAAGTLGGAEGTLGGAINGPTGFVQGCIGGAVSGATGTTECFPVATAPAATDTASHAAAGNAAGTLGVVSGFVDSEGLCAGGAVGNDGFTTCLRATQTS